MRCPSDTPRCDESPAAGIAEAPSPGGSSSTHPSLTGETGTDTVRLLYAVASVPPRPFGFTLSEDWRVDPLPGFGMVAVEGNPANGALWGPGELLERGEAVREVIDGTFGVQGDKGVSRLDVTTSRRFTPKQGRAFMAGMAAVELPRMEATRRGSPPHSVWWTGARTAVIRARTYCESFKVASREPFERLRLEDQRRFPTARRIDLETAADPAQQRRFFLRRFEPMRKAVDGVTAASFPVVAQALADEARYGYRDVKEAERLAGALVLLGGGAGEAYSRATFYRRRAELRSAGYVVVEDFMEPTKVNLGEELELALEGFGG